MAKHLGTHRVPRLASRSRGVAWGVGGLLGVATVTVLVVVQGMAADDAGSNLGAASRHGDDVAHISAADGDAHAGHGVAPGARRVEVSRQAVRPLSSRYRVQRGTTLSLRPAVVLARKINSLSPTHSTFTIAQSNILGSQHTAGRGGYGPGGYRAGITASLLTSRGTDVGGMQEVQSDQLAVLRNRMPSYSFWPGSSLGHNGERLQIYWRSDRFTMEKSGSVSYVFSSQRIPLPYVLLRDNDTGAEFWMITTHNSAGGMEGQRDAATGVEINLINDLKATGVPVVITGDMNEHTEFFCRVAAATGMVAANGGYAAGGCHLPPPPLRVDWIMGGGGVSFSGYRQDGAGLHRASDHYYLYAQVATTSDWFAPGATP
jgi:endonuclease/exonuclease/phosphatase family metal-dependent hydrolase